MVYENVMSNCSVKLSPHGGIHDEQEGSAPGGPGARRPRRPDHQPAGRHGLAPVGSTIPPPQEALRPRRAAGLAASQPRTAVPAPPRRQRITALITTAYPGLWARSMTPLPAHRGSPRLRRHLRPGLPAVWLLLAVNGNRLATTTTGRSKKAWRPAPHPPRAHPAGARRRPGPLANS